MLIFCSMMCSTVAWPTTKTHKKIDKKSKSTAAVTAHLQPRDSQGQDCGSQHVDESQHYNVSLVVGIAQI